MRKIAPILFNFVYGENLNMGGVDHAYDRIFDLARKKMIDSESTKEYTDTYGRDGNLSNTRGSSQKNEGGADYCLQDVSSWQNTSDKVWRSVEDQPKGIDSIIKRKRE